MNSRKKILILGGGVGGIVTANRLRHLLPIDNDVILIEKNELHSFAPSFLWLMTGQRTDKDIVRSVASLLDKGIEIRYEEVNSLDIKQSIVHTNKKIEKYDYLVIALGAELHAESVPGLPLDTHNFYDLNGAKNLFGKLNTFNSGKIAVVVASLPFKCPAAPYEGAMLISDFYRKKGILENIEISLFTPELLPMPVGGPVLGNSVKQIIESRGINFHPLHKLYEVDGISKELHFEGQKSYNYNMLIVIPPHKATSVVRQSELSGENGWIPVDRSTLQTKFPNVYAIGDTTSIAIPGTWIPGVPMFLPKAGVFAHLQADTV
jgi:sulfide:quinone oxidoreductase